MAIKGILFDLDGTLCNTLEDLAEATNVVMTRHGFTAKPTENFKQYVGNGAKMQLMRAIGQELPEEVFSIIHQDYIEYYGAHYLEKTCPYNGVPKMVSALHKQGIIMAVVTNKPQAMATNIVKELFGDIFKGVWGNNPDFPLKPDPTMTLHVMKALHIKPSETLFVGDSGVDILTAKNAGATAVGVTWGFRGREELEQAGADFLVNAPGEILDIVLERI